MTVHLKRQLFTVKEYYKMAEVGILKSSDKVELLNGEIIQISPINNYHANIVDAIQELLAYELLGKYKIRIQGPIRINRNSEPEPDILVSIKPPSKNYKKNPHPSAKDALLIVEVSDSTLQKDRQIKLPIYAAANIPEYWIVNLVDEQIEVYLKPKGEQYQIKKIYEKGDTIKCSQLDFKLSIDDVFC
ncbi:MAG: Uma2 family endonuclease [Bacteroidota bacterium]